MVKVKKYPRDAAPWVVSWREPDGYTRRRTFSSASPAIEYGLKLYARLQLDELALCERGH